MINRRHLRIKVLQALYSWFQSGDGDYGKSERELMKNIDKIYELYLLYLLLLSDLQTIASNRIEDGKAKKLPTRQDLEPNLKFVENPVLELISKNKSLQAEAHRRKLSWGPEMDMLKKIFQEIRNSDVFAKYMDDPGRNFVDAQEFVVTIFKDFVANSEALQNWLEEVNIHWLDDIDLVCAAVIKTIKGFQEKSDEFIRLLPLYKDPEEDEKFVKDLFRKTIMNSAETEALISSKTDNWELERIASMDMILMKMAITEVSEFSTIPVKVTLNEFIEISKFYSTPKSNGFINGILDKVFAQLKSEGKIKKIGRGLIEG